MTMSKKRITDFFKRSGQHIETNTDATVSNNDIVIQNESTIDNSDADHPDKVYLFHA